MVGKKYGGVRVAVAPRRRGLHHEAANAFLTLTYRRIYGMFSLYLLYTNSTHLYPDVGDTCRHRLNPPDLIENRAEASFDFSKW